MLSTFASAVRSGTAIGIRLANSLLRAIWAIVTAFCQLLGIAPRPAPRIPQPAVTPESISRDTEREYQARRKRDHVAASDIGLAVHRYAAASGAEARSAIDLTGLTDEQYDWLMKLSNDDLERLATAGPAACERAVNGHRCGIVGLAVPRERSVAFPPDAAERVRNLVREHLRDRQSASVPNLRLVA